jgi:putative transcriptional regulator
MLWEPQVEISSAEIVKLRRRLGLTQEQFCERFQLEKQTLATWEQGRRTPRGASALYLIMIQRSPETVVHLLMQEARPRRRRLEIAA